MTSRREEIIWQKRAVAVAVISIVIGVAVGYFSHDSLDSFLGVQVTQRSSPPTTLSVYTTVTSVSVQTVFQTTTQVVTQTVTAPPPAMVEVYGKVSTVTAGTYPTQITYQYVGGSPYTIPVNNSGFYVLTSIPNHQTYSVTLTYARYLGGGGTTVCATFSLLAGAGTQPLRLDWAC